jgi:putative addiction module component (TIGR02574 family)
MEAAMTVRELESKALKLSARDRAQLAEHLILSLDEDEDPGSEKAWLDVAESRYAAYRKGKLRARPAAAALKRARARLP